MSEELKVHAAAEAFYCGKPLAVVHDPVNGPLVKASALLDAFKAGAAWQMGRVVADVAGDRDVKEQLQPNEGGYRLRLNGDGPHELHHFGNPEALKALREVFANGTTLDSKDAAAIPRRVPRMPTPHDELMAKLEDIHRRLAPPPSDHVPLTEIMAAVIDVGQKVEAVLDQVTPRDNGPYNATEPADTAESEADHWQRRARELQAQRDDWHGAYDKLVSDIVHGRLAHVRLTIGPDRQTE